MHPVRNAFQPSATGGDIPSVIGWRKAYSPDPSPTSLGAVPFMGVRESVLREDSTHVFWSGIAPGTVVPLRWRGCRRCWPHT
jgi:hypothetical protein